MITNVNILSQSSFGLNGYWGLSPNFNTPLYIYESNTSNYSHLKDWGLSLIYGMEFSEEINSNIYSLSLAKTFGKHNLSARFTPGYQKEFIFNTGEAIIVEDTSAQSLTANFNYKELFGLGYSYKFSDQFSVGTTFRYFTQDFNQEIVTPVFEDTLYLLRDTQNEKINFWKADIGLNYVVDEHLNFSIASINLLNFGEKADNSDFERFEIIRDAGAMFGVSVLPINSLAINFIYETTNSYQLSINGYRDELGLGLTLFHDKYQSPTIAGMIPTISYRGEIFELFISGVKYFSDRKINFGVTGFVENGITNIINNEYSFDKIMLTVSFNINTAHKKSVEIIDVQVVKDIYPTFTDNYIDYPFAYADIVNLTDEYVTVKPMARIEGVNEENIQSPISSIAPFDTAKVPFYIIIPESYVSDKAVLSYADFYLLTSSDQPDDQFQKAVLINSNNSWDGRVSNLQYFIKKDLEYSINYSKTVLSDNKSLLDTLHNELEDFYKAKILFDEFIKHLTYISDPRATGEYVQFPNQTIELKGGDCDDLSVCYSSLLESVGIQTALVDYKSNGKIRHVNILLNTKLLPNQARIITNNDTKYFVRESIDGKDEIWIPVEVTSLTDFETAWNLGAEKFNKEAINELGLVKGKVAVIDIY
ncbi:MAG: transglutaminase domain-containing protein [Ignavibacteriaceae bacterium]